MLYRVGVPWWGSSLSAATKEDRLPIGNLPVGTGIQF